MSNKKSILQALEVLYPVSSAESWDRVGLVIDSKNETYKSILLTVDLTKNVIEEAKNIGANLVISHHPLWVEEVTTHSKMISDEALKANIDLYVIHTNGDRAVDGVNDCLASALGLKNVMRFTDTDLGRIGNFEAPMETMKVVELLSRALPSTQGVIQVSGPLDEEILRVGVCAGSGGSLIEHAHKEKVDAYITSDLKHHMVLENKGLGGPILISVPHWASEYLWLPELNKQLMKLLSQKNIELKIFTCKTSTDPWDFSLGSKI
jgi:dinuclear metal center YbgI/SA1388 family protein